MIYVIIIHYYIKMLQSDLTTTPYVNMFITLIGIPITAGFLILTSIFLYLKYLRAHLINTINVGIESQNRKKKTTELEVNIDFDESSKVWKENKISLGDGMYKYRKTRNCKSKTAKGNDCKNKTAFDYCSVHNN